MNLGSATSQVRPSSARSIGHLRQRADNYLVRAAEFSRISQSSRRCSVQSSFVITFRHAPNALRGLPRFNGTMKNPVRGSLSPDGEPEAGPAQEAPKGIIIWLAARWRKHLETGAAV